MRVCGCEIAYFIAVSFCFSTFGTKISSSKIVYLLSQSEQENFTLLQLNEKKEYFRMSVSLKLTWEISLVATLNTQTVTTLCWRAFRPFWISLCTLKSVNLSGLMVCLCVHDLCLSLQWGICLWSHTMLTVCLISIQIKQVSFAN